MSVAGSTLKVYEVRAKERSGTIACSCPDMQSHARRSGCVCKHVCFVVSRVGRIDGGGFGEFYRGTSHTLTRDQFRALKSRVVTDRCWTRDPGVADERLTRRFLEITSTSTVESDAPPRPADPDDECPICYERLLDAGKALVQCPGCRNRVHDACMRRWLAMRNTCVYCRAPFHRAVAVAHPKDYLQLDVAV